MHFLVKLSLVVLANAVNLADGLDTTAEIESKKTFIDYYDDGVQSYLENNFKDCVENLEHSVDHYRQYYHLLTQCRVECGYKMSRERPFFPFNHDNLQFFDKILKRTLCLVECYDNIYVDGVKYPRHLEISKFYKNAFRFRKAYEYLQLCYYREDNIDAAATATYTALVRNPEDKMMMKNFEYYLEKLGTVPEVDLEEPRFASFYHRGMQLYERGNYRDAIDQLENSLNEYILEENKCRTFCEGEFDHGWLPDLYSATANHFVFTLHCKRNCTDDFRWMRGKYYDDIFPTHYEYLHYSYFKEKNLEQAIQCALSFLLFYPDDEVMLENLKLYLSYQNEAAGKEIDEPRPEAREYLERVEYEKQLLAFVYKEFGGKLVVETPKRYVAGAELTPSEENEVVDEPTSPAPKGINSDKNNRFLLDHIITNDECEELLHLLHAAAIAGDGYDGDPNPHTPHETLIGMRVSRVALLTYFKLINSTNLKLLLRTTETIRQIVEKQFHIKDHGTLYFTYTHLVCRQANPGSQPDRFSHEIHADNCILRGNNTCDRIFPAYTWRDVSALLYLNNQDHDFYGGDFIFTADEIGQKVEDHVHPKCGRLLTFTSGVANKHGVKPVTRGERCALAIWFTFDPQHKEIDYEMGAKVLSKMENIEKSVNEL